MFVNTRLPLAQSIRSDSLVEVVLSTIQSPIVLWDSEGCPLVFNTAACNVFGYASKDFERLNRSSLVHEEEELQVAELAAARKDGDTERRSFRRRLVTSAGDTIHADCVSAVIVLDEDATCVLVEYRDVSAEVEAQALLEQERQRYQRLFERGNVAIFTTDAGNRFETANPKCLALLQLRLEELQRFTPIDLVHPDFQAQMLERRSTRGRQGNDEIAPFEVPVRVGDGDFTWAEVLMLPRFDEEGRFVGADGFARDISAERSAQEQLEAEALSDPLTGLGNRRRLTQFLDERLGEARRYGAPLSLLVLDLDHFKRINDRHGHLAGDAVLKQTALVLREIAREADLVARFGGEEFAVVAPQTDRDGARALAERVRVAVQSMECTFEGKVLKASASIGVAAYEPTIHEDGDDLFRDADGATYAAKSAGRNTVCVANDLAPPLARRSA